MGELADRLRRQPRPIGVTGAGPPSGACAAPPDAAVLATESRLEPTGEIPGATFETTPHGRVLTVRHRLAVHGDVAMFEARSTDPRDVAGGVSLRAEDLLFLDTETTGLAGGAGTFAFLLGLGWFEGDELVVVQYFLRDPDDEAAMLYALGVALTPRRAVATYNGRAYDAVLLENRCVLHRQTSPLRGRPHLDLLHVARRLWRHRLSDCTLPTIERHVLGVHRGADVPGYVIPGLYFDYLRHADPTPLLPVFRHNLLDVASLATLLCVAARCLDDPERWATCGGDLLGAAHVLERAGERTRALGLLERACASAGPARRLAYQKLFLAHRREGRYADAAATCRRWSEDHPDDPCPLLELAKHAEHRERDPGGALALAHRVRRLLHDGVSVSDVDRRIDRLRRRLGQATNERLPAPPEHTRGPMREQLVAWARHGARAR